jgi:hypothetical protein
MDAVQAIVVPIVGCLALVRAWRLFRDLAGK